MFANLAVVLFRTALAATPCANLKSVSLPDTTITLACPYPQVAQYKGVGSTNDAANFVFNAPQSNAN